MKKQILASTLIIALLAAGCGSENPTVDTTTAADDTTAAETSPDNIPLGTDLGGRTVRIYTRGDTNATEFDAEQSGDIVDDAIYARNRSIEDRLNVTLEYVVNTSEDFWADRTIYMDTVRGAVLANDGSIDIAAGLSNIMPELAQDGMFFNLLAPDMPYFDFDSPWWPSELVDELSVQGRLYMTSGEVCLGTIKGLMCFYFNKNMVEDLQLENPYDLVKAGKWTLDKFSEMAASAYSDLNGNTKVDADDRFGFLISNENHSPNFIIASGIRLTEKDSDDLPYYNLGSEKFIDTMDRLYDIMTQDGFIVKPDGDDTYTNIFTEGRTLFQTGEFKNAEIYRDLTFDFGIIPFPKGSEEQSDYFTTVRSTYSSLGILVTANKSDCAAVIEALAAENYRTVTPAYYEKALKVKYARDDVSSQMFDLIKGHISFDFGLVHGVMMGGVTTLLRRSIAFAEGDWSSKWASNETAVNAAVEKYLENILSLDN